MYRYSLWLALSLVACGGGGGGDTTPPKPTEPENGWLTFDKPDVVVLQGDSEQVTVKATSTKALSAPLNVRVDATDEFVSGTTVTYEKIAGFEFNLSTATSAPVGKRSGVLKVFLCSDDARVCNSPYPGSPWTVPYEIEVVSKALKQTPLAMLPGAVAWNNLGGNAARTGYVTTNITLSPANFSLRWAKRGGPSTSMWRLTEAVVVDGRVYTGGNSLRAYGEADGTLLWGSSFNSGPAVVSQGNVFSYADETTFAPNRLYVRNAVTGSSVNTPDHYEGQEDRSLLVADDDSVYAPFTFRMTAVDGIVAWRDYAPMRSLPSRASDRLYMADASNVYARDIKDGREIARIATGGEQREVRRATGTLADGQDRVLVSHFNQGNASLGSYSIGQKQKLWDVEASFRSRPALAGDTVYVVNVPQPAKGVATLEARSSATGAVVWSTPLPDAVVPVGEEAVYHVAVVGNLVFVSSDRKFGASTYAIDRSSHAIGWRHPVNGSLAVSDNGILYVAQALDASLFAINLR